MCEDIGRHFRTRRRYRKATLGLLMEIFVLYSLQSGRETDGGREGEGKRQSQGERAEEISKREKKRVQGKKYRHEENVCFCN